MIMMELTTAIKIVCGVLAAAAAGFVLGWLSAKDSQPDITLPRNRPLPNKGSSGSRDAPSLELIIQRGQDRLYRKPELGS